MFGVIGLIFTFVMLVLAVVLAIRVGMVLAWFWFIGTCFGVLAFFCLILAEEKRKPMLYLPFLIIGVCLFFA